jgi:hypothetical protein
MSQPLSFSLNLELELFQLEQATEALARAKRINGVLYSWKTTGVLNWLERGLSISDLLGIVILPKGMPDQIDLPDDPPETCS